MLAKAKYFKEITVTDEITQEEIDQIVYRGMPARFDYMADQIDNEKPLELVNWCYASKEDMDSDIEKQAISKEAKSDTIYYLIMLLPTIIMTALLCIYSGIYTEDRKTAVVYICTCFVLWIVAVIIIKWIKKVNKMISIIANQKKGE